MVQGYKIFALLLALFLLFLGIAYLVSLEARFKRDQKRRERIYRAEMYPFKRSGVRHSENKIPALYRIKQAEQASIEMT